MYLGRSESLFVNIGSRLGFKIFKYLKLLVVYDLLITKFNYYLKMIVIVFLALVAYALSVRVEQKQYFLSHVFDHYGFLYLDQMGYASGKGTAQFDISFHGTLSNRETEPHVYIGYLAHHKFKQFEEQKSCQSRQKLLTSKKYVKLDNVELARVKLEINEPAETIIDFYLYNCDNTYTTEAGSLTLYIKVSWDLNYDGSHLNSKEDLLPYYYGITWVILTIMSFTAAKRYFQFEVKTPIYFWVMMVSITFWVAQSIKLLYLYLHFYSGGYYLLSVAYELVKAISQSLLTVIYLLIGFGWTVTHIRTIKDYAGPIGGSIIIINIICILFSHLLEDGISKIHVYDSISFIILLGIKAFMGVVFVLGLLKSYYDSVNIKTQNFIKQFGMNGFFYLISQPLIVVLVSLVFKIEHQNQTIVILTDLAHLYWTWFITKNVLSFSSQYAKLDFNHNTVFRSYDPLKQF